MIWLKGLLFRGWDKENGIENKGSILQNIGKNGRRSERGIFEDNRKYSGVPKKMSGDRDYRWKERGGSESKGRW